jgi:hypothetical protein
LRAGRNVVEESGTVEQRLKPPATTTPLSGIGWSPAARTPFTNPFKSCTRVVIRCNQPDTATLNRASRRRPGRPFHS